MEKFNFLPYWYVKKQKDFKNKKIKILLGIETIFFLLMCMLWIFSNEKLKDMKLIENKKLLNLSTISTQKKADKVFENYKSVRTLLNGKFPFNSMVVDKNFITIEFTCENLDKYKEIVKYLKNNKIQISRIEKIKKNDMDYGYELKVKKV